MNLFKRIHCRNIGSFNYIPSAVLIDRYHKNQNVYPPDEFLICSKVQKYYENILNNKEESSKKINEESFSIHVSSKALEIVKEINKMFSFKRARLVSEEIYFDSKNWRSPNDNEINLFNEFFPNESINDGSNDSYVFKVPPIKLSPFHGKKDGYHHLLKRKMHDSYAQVFDIADHNGPFRNLQRDVICLEVDSKQDLWVKDGDLPHGNMDFSDFSRLRLILNDNPMLAYNPMELIQIEVSVIRNLMLTAEWRQNDILMESAVADFSFLFPNKINKEVEKIKTNPSETYKKFQNLFNQTFQDCLPLISRIIPDVSKSSIYTIYNNMLKIDPNYEKNDILTGMRTTTDKQEIEACDIDIYRKRLAQRVLHWNDWVRINWGWLQWANSGKSQRRSLEDTYRCHVTLELMCMELKQLALDNIFAFQRISLFYEALQRIQPTFDSKVLCHTHPTYSIVEFPMKNGLRIKSFIGRDRRLHPSKALYLLIRLSQIEFYKNRKDIRQAVPLLDKIFSNSLIYDNLLNETFNLKDPQDYVRNKSTKSHDPFIAMILDTITCDNHMNFEINNIFESILEKNKKDPLKRYVISQDE